MAGFDYIGDALDAPTLSISWPAVGLLLVPAVCSLPFLPYKNVALMVDQAGTALYRICSGALPEIAKASRDNARAEDESVYQSVASVVIDLLR
jgi:hypothetical protein